MFTVEIEYRLKNVFEEEFFTRSTTTFQFSEDSKDGKMGLELKINDPSLCIMNLDKKKPIQFLNQKRGTYARRADYAVFEFTSGKTCRIHIFEMTTTVSQSKWETKIKQQIKSSYIYCMAVAACLNIEVNDVIFYTIYANDDFATRVSAEDDHSTAFSKAPLGIYRPNPQEEWAKNTVEFDFGQWFKFKHEKIVVIQQDEAYPTGSYEISKKV